MAGDVLKFLHRKISRVKTASAPHLYGVGDVPARVQRRDAILPVVGAAAAAAACAGAASAAALVEAGARRRRRVRRRREEVSLLDRDVTAATPGVFGVFPHEELALLRRAPVEEFTQKISKHFVKFLPR